jgi:hypothetical protein
MAIVGGGNSAAGGGLSWDVRDSATGAFVSETGARRLRHPAMPLTTTSTAASAFPQGNVDGASSESTSVATGTGAVRDRILAKMTPQRGQTTGPGFVWPQRGQSALPAVSALVGVVGTVVKARW